MSFPTYINFQVNNSGGGRSNMVVHSNAVILMLLSLFPESFGIFLFEALEFYVCRKGHCLYPCFERFYSNTGFGRLCFLG